jgi:hypothetical protein
LPELAWLAPEFAVACSAGRFVQGDMSRDCRGPSNLFCFFRLLSVSFFFEAHFDICFFSFLRDDWCPQIEKETILIL